MDYNSQNCTGCMESNFEWVTHQKFNELKSQTSSWLFSNQIPDQSKYDEINFPLFFKNYPLNMTLDEYGYLYRADNWNTDWNCAEKSKVNLETSESSENFDCDNIELIPPQNKINSLNSVKCENFVSALKDSTDYSDILTKMEFKDEVEEIPEQHLTFTSPESAFYDYQQKMENQLCQVCRESAAGFHHGAYVCEACKKFFMRHNLNCTKFTIPCPTGGQCAQLKTGRIKCQSCRFKKCIAIGMALQNPNNSNTKFDISKIPCRVCGGKSSGFHFGALTCEGCKGFFRRTESTNQQLACITGTNDCALTGSSSRNLCKSCRFNRCLEVGMSKKGSRIGRQPNAVKFHCVLEIMQRSQEQTDKRDGIFNDFTKRKPIFLRNYRKLHLHSHKQSIKSDKDDFEKLKRKNSIFFTNEAFCSEEEKFLFENSIKEATRIIEISKGNLHDLSNREFSKKYMTLNDLWNYMMNYFDVHSAMTVQFVKAIPGFNKFELKSRRSLVQEAMYPIMLLKLAQDYKADIDEYNYFDFSVTDRELILNNFQSFKRLTDHLLTVSRMVFTLQLPSYLISLMCVIELMKNYHFLSCPEDGKRILNQTKSLLWSFLESEEINTNRNVKKVILTENQNLSVLPKKSLQRYQIIFEELPKLLSEMNLEHLKIIQELKYLHPELVFPELYIDMFNIQDPQTLGDNN